MRRGLDTPFHAAVNVESEVMIAAVLGYGANRRIKNTLERAPLDLKDEWKPPSIVELLNDS